MLFYIKICKYVYFFVSLQMFSADCARRQVNKRKYYSNLNRKEFMINSQDIKNGVCIRMDGRL